MHPPTTTSAAASPSPCQGCPLRFKSSELQPDALFFRHVSPAGIEMHGNLMLRFLFSGTKPNCVAQKKCFDVFSSHSVVPASRRKKKAGRMHDTESRALVLISEANYISSPCGRRCQNWGRKSLLVYTKQLR